MGSTRHFFVGYCSLLSQFSLNLPNSGSSALRCPFANLVVPMPLAAVAADAVRMAAFGDDDDDGDGSCALSMMCNVTNGKERESL